MFILRRFSLYMKFVRDSIAGFALAIFRGAEKTSSIAKRRIKSAKNISDYTRASVSLYFAPLLGGTQGLVQYFSDRKDGSDS